MVNPLGKQHLFVAAAINAFVINQANKLNTLFTRKVLLLHFVFGLVNVFHETLNSPLIFERNIHLHSFESSGTLQTKFWRLSRRDMLVTNSSCVSLKASLECEIVILMHWWL